MTSLGLCQCGCGRTTSICTNTDTKRGIRAGQPMPFVHGHNRRVRPHVKPINTSFFCACGCGGLVSLDESGKARRFINGHYARTIRIENGSGSNPSGVCLCGCGQKTEIAACGSRKLGRVEGMPILFVHGHNGVRYKRSFNSQTPEYKSWHGMMRRCDNKKDSGYENYGGRGIKVIGKLRTFEGFSEVLGKMPHPGLTLGRKDNDGNYEEGNVGWENRHEQAINMRRPKLDVVKVREIRELKASGWTSLEIASKFRITARHVNHVIERKYWGHA